MPKSLLWKRSRPKIAPIPPWRSNRDLRKKQIAGRRSETHRRQLLALAGASAACWIRVYPGTPAARRCENFREIAPRSNWPGLEPVWRDEIRGWKQCGNHNSERAQGVLSEISAERRF